MTQASSSVGIARVPQFWGFDPHQMCATPDWIGLICLFQICDSVLCTFVSHATSFVNSFSHQNLHVAIYYLVCFILHTQYHKYVSSSQSDFWQCSVTVPPKTSTDLTQMQRLHPPSCSFLGQFPHWLLVASSLGAPVCCCGCR